MAGADVQHTTDVVTCLHLPGLPMVTTTISSREFNQDTSRAKKAAREGPVIITDRGQPAHVLLTFDDYQKLAGGGGSLVDLLGLPPGIEDVEIETRPARDRATPADLR